MPLPLLATREHRLWAAAVVWLLAIYSTLYVARPITEALRERNLLRAAVTAAFGLAAAGVVLWGRRRRLAARQWTVVAVAGAVVLAVASLLPLPEERLHFVEYGLFAALVHGALRERGTSRAPAWTVALTAAAGLGDEAIQGILPNRYFGWRDVAMNAGAAVAVALTLPLLELLQRSEE
jgi:hypothetical protein